MNEEFERHLQLGRHLFEARLCSRAKGEFEAALLLEPENNYARLMLVRVLRELGLLEEARREVGIALGHNPNDPDAHYMASYVAPTFEKALPHIESALKLSPERADYLVHRAYLLARLGRFEESLEMARSAVAIAPELGSAHQQLAETIFDEAEQAARVAGKVGLTRAKRDEAAMHVTAALRLEPEIPHSHAVEARLQFWDQEYETSLERWQEAVRLNPNDEYALWHLRQAQGHAQLDRFAKRVWNICFRWMPWPIPLPLMLGLTWWSWVWHPLAFLLVGGVALIVSRILIRDWLRFVPDRFLEASLRPLRKPPLR